MHLDPARGYDLIGDIHGCAKTLERLLSSLGYRQQAGVWQHPKRMAIFLGDLVDRGPRIREALHLVRDMVTAGQALCIMGNHEFNALAWSTPAAPGSGRQFVREHTPRHARLIKETLEQFDAYPAEWQGFLDWFYELPLFIDAGHGSFANTALDRLLRGTDMRLPHGMTLTSDDGFTRAHFRTKFWEEDPQTYGDIVFQPDALPELAAQMPLSEMQKTELLKYGADQPLLFVGHYWRSGKPAPIRSNLACLDYSAVLNGKLVAYRLDQETRLEASKFVWVDVDSPEARP